MRDDRSHSRGPCQLQRRATRAIAELRSAPALTSARSAAWWRAPPSPRTTASIVAVQWRLFTWSNGAPAAISWRTTRRGRGARRRSARCRRSGWWSSLALAPSASSSAMSARRRRRRRSSPRRSGRCRARRGRRRPGQRADGVTLAGEVATCNGVRPCASRESMAVASAFSAAARRAVSPAWAAACTGANAATSAAEGATCAGNGGAHAAKAASVHPHRHRLSERAAVRRCPRRSLKERNDSRSRSR